MMCSITGPAALASGCAHQAARGVEWGARHARADDCDQFVGSERSASLLRLLSTGQRGSHGCRPASHACNTAPAACVPPGQPTAQAAVATVAANRSAMAAGDWWEGRTARGPLRVPAHGGRGWRARVELAARGGWVCTRTHDTTHSRIQERWWRRERQATAARPAVALPSGDGLRTVHGFWGRAQAGRWGRPAWDRALFMLTSPRAAAGLAAAGRSACSAIESAGACGQAGGVGRAPLV